MKARARRLCGGCAATAVVAAVVLVVVVNSNRRTFFNSDSDEAVYLKMVANGFANYLEDCDDLPAPQSAIAGCGSVNSWRLALYAWCEAGVGCDATQCWTDPVNEDLRCAKGAVFIASNAEQDYRTCIVAVVGAGTVYNAWQAGNRDTDGERNRLLVVLGAPVGVHWMEGLDLDLDDPVRCALVWDALRTRRTSVWMAFGDFSVREVDSSIPYERVLKVMKWSADYGEREQILGEWLLE